MRIKNDFVEAAIILTGCAVAAIALTGCAKDKNLRDIVKDVEPSVVLVKADDGLGSGFSLDNNGYIVTAWHVASKENTKIIVIGYDGHEYGAHFVGGDKSYDVSVLKIDQFIKPVKWGDSDLLQQGDSVFVIGHPFGYKYSVSRGIVSALDRSLHSPLIPAHFIQIDAACNPGSSGGPVFNDAGEVEGIVDRIATNEFASQNSGVSFVVPGEVVRKIAANVLVNGG